MLSNLGVQMRRCVFLIFHLKIYIQNSLCVFFLCDLELLLLLLIQGQQDVCTYIQLRIRCTLRPGCRMRLLHLKVQQRLLHTKRCSCRSQKWLCSWALRKVSCVAFRQCSPQEGGGHLALNLRLKEQQHCLLILLELKMNSELALI